MNNKAKPSLGRIFLLLFLVLGGGGAFGYLYLSGALGDVGVTSQKHYQEEARKELNRIQQDVASDFVKQYNVAVKRGDDIESSVRAGLVAEAYLQAGNEAKYNKWKDIEASHKAAAGM